MGLYFRILDFEKSFGFQWTKIYNSEFISSDTISFSENYLNISTLWILAAYHVIFMTFGRLEVEFRRKWKDFFGENGNSKTSFPLFFFNKEFILHKIPIFTDSFYPSNIQEHFLCNLQAFSNVFF